MDGLRPTQEHRLLVMKKIIYLLVALVLPFAIVSCEEDRDSNPIIQTPSSFVLNIPPDAANNTYVLAHSDSIILTTSQPNYGTTLSTAYQVQVSLDGTKFATMSTTYTTARLAIAPEELNDSIKKLAGDAFSATVQPIYVRLHAKVNGTDSLGSVYSNVIKLPNVLPFAEKASGIQLPTTMYVIGSFAPSGWNWAATKPMAPVIQVDGAFYGVYYFAAGDMFKVGYEYDNWSGVKGYQQVTIDDKAGAGITGEKGNTGDNLKVEKAGWYTLVVETALSGKEYTYNVTIRPAEVYLMNPAPGSWSTKDAAAKFSVPAGPTGEFTSPVLTATEENVRVAVNIGQSDWWRAELTLYKGTTLHYRLNSDNVAKSWADISADYLMKAGVGNTISFDFINHTGAVR